MNPQLLTVTQAANRLNGEMVVRRAIDQGRLTAVREGGRIWVSEVEVEALVKERQAKNSRNIVMGVPIANGARLTAALAESGTGRSKLEICRDLLQRVHAAADRVATSAEIITVLEANLEPTHATLKKARSLAETGLLPVALDDSDFQLIEDVLLAARDAGAMTNHG